MKDTIYKIGTIFLVLIGIYVILKITIYLLPFALGIIALIWIIKKIKNTKAINKDPQYTYTKKSEPIIKHNNVGEVIDVDYEEVDK